MLNFTGQLDAYSEKQFTTFITEVLASNQLSVVIDLSNIDFIERLENAWSICEQFDLQTEIWRGRILRVVRDREREVGMEEVQVFCSG